MGKATRRLPVAAGDVMLRSDDGALMNLAVLRQLFSLALHHEI